MGREEKVLPLFYCITRNSASKKATVSVHIATGTAEKSIPSSPHYTHWQRQGETETMKPEVAVQKQNKPRSFHNIEKLRAPAGQRLSWGHGRGLKSMI